MGRSEKKKVKSSKKAEQAAHELKDYQFTEELEKVKRGDDLAAVFSLFSLLEPQHRRKKGSKRKRTPIENDFLANVTSILKIFFQFQRNHKTTSWAELFYEYMCTTVENGKFENFLNLAQISHVEIILQDFVAISMPVDGDVLVQTLVDVSEELLKFLKEHSIDPFSCLVGLVASKDVVENTKSDKEFYSTVIHKKGSHEELLKQVMMWAAIDDAQQLQKEIRAYAGKLRGIKNLNNGSLVLVEISKEKYIYGRFSGGECNENLANIYINPKEDKVFNIKLDDIYPLKPSVVKRITERSPLELEKLVQLPTDPLYQSIMRKVESETHGYFQKVLQIDMDVVRKANMNQCSISELQELTLAMQQLKKIANDPPSELFSTLDKTINNQIEEFLQSGENEKTFIPTKEKNLQQLKSFRVTGLVMMHVQRYIGICESGLDQLKLQKRELMSGERKDKISEWWLHEIDVEVLAYLESL